MPEPTAEDPGEGSSSRPREDSRVRRRRSSTYEVTELARIRSQYSQTSTARIQAAGRPTARPSSGPARLQDALRRFWVHQISVTVDHDACRDHLALERTFLGYLRTSLAISIIGVLVAQLFRLQHSPTPDATFGFYVLGKPLACICQGVAMYALGLGAFRTWRSQNAIIRGKAIAGGFEIVLLGVGVFVMTFSFFVLLIAVDISKEY